MPGHIRYTRHAHGRHYGFCKAYYREIPDELRNFIEGMLKTHLSNLEARIRELSRQKEYQMLELTKRVRDVVKEWVNIFQECQQYE